MSMRSEAVGVASRTDVVRGPEGFPLVPVAILAAIALVAIFANVLAPHDPEIGTLTARVPGCSTAAMKPRVPASWPRSIPR